MLKIAANLNDSGGCPIQSCASLLREFKILHAAFISILSTIVTDISVSQTRDLTESQVM